MAFKEILTNSFLDDLKDIKKDKALLDRLDKKMTEISRNPEHYPKKYNMKGKRAAHVGSFVAVFEVIGEDVVFYRFKHHDFAYS